MLAHCVNPDCCAPLESFPEGRLYQFEIVSISIAASDSALAAFDEKPERQAVHYWLCGRCAANLNLRLEPRQGLQVVPLAKMEDSAIAMDEGTEGRAFARGNSC
jgi:hypothetical protein